MCNTGFRVCTTRGSQGINDKVDLSQVLFYQLNSLFFHLVRKSIAIYTLGIQSCCVCLFFEGCTIVPIRSPRFTGSGWFFKKYARSEEHTSELQSRENL